MNWTSFLIAISAVYTLYYTFNLLFDLLLQPSTKETSVDDHLLHYEEPTPSIAYDEQSPTRAAPSNTNISDKIISGEIISSASASFADLQRLAQEELIEYTKAIPY